MRRYRLIAWLLIAALVLDWAPGLPPLPLLSVAQVRGQTPFSLIGPAGSVYYTTASIPIANRNDAVWLTSLTVPGSLFSTSAAANFNNVANLQMANSSVPLHLVIDGLLNLGSSPGTLNIGVNFGVGTTTRPAGCTAGSGANSCWFATINLVNGFTPGLGTAYTDAPVKIDVWLNPTATLTATNATPNIVNTMYMHARIELPQGTAGGAAPSTAITINVGTVAQVNIASAHLLNVVWQFGTAQATNVFRVLKVILKQAD